MLYHGKQIRYKRAEGCSLKANKCYDKDIKLSLDQNLSHIFPSIWKMTVQFQ